MAKYENKYALDQQVRRKQDDQEMANWITANYNYLEFQSGTKTEQIDAESGHKINETMYKVKQSVPLSSIGGLNALFNAILALKQAKTIKDFSITRSSLETVFVQFAKHQIE